MSRQSSIRRHPTGRARREISTMFHQNAWQRPQPQHKRVGKKLSEDDFDDFADEEDDDSRQQSGMKKRNSQGYQNTGNQQYSRSRSAIPPVTFRPPYMRFSPNSEKDFFSRRSADPASKGRRTETRRRSLSTPSSNNNNRDPTKTLIAKNLPNLDKQASNTRPKSDEDDFHIDDDDDSDEIRFDDDDDDDDYGFGDGKKSSTTTTTTTTTTTPKPAKKDDVERRFFAPVKPRRGQNFRRPQSPALRPFPMRAPRPLRNRAANLGEVPVVPSSLNDVDGDASGTNNNGLLGSGNFEVITGGLFSGSTDYEETPEDEFGDGFLGAKHHPYRQNAGGRPHYRRRHKNPPQPHRIHPNDILSNFRDFAEIHYRGSLSQDKPQVVAASNSVPADLMAVDS